ncbi:uncharacterized protein LOC129586965 [Paramacrobiotus metropolitanus]|uniref:uncharacterized protein LOC129586965 n=1 Tax=Paramacrobiotus metropolitanus TaxID=2943436 RepID=UPI0024459A81|nr:uncharacterized protein LOC129586965 [Paramacrobiotus metropolitanus]XP_055336501.1 uncharacterized protein LOC129586965 [Paramacrobiotus metropolitanus]
MDITGAEIDPIQNFYACVQNAAEALKQLECQISSEEIEQEVLERRLDYYRRFVTEHFCPAVSTEDKQISTDYQQEVMKIDRTTVGTSTSSVAKFEVASAVQTKSLPQFVDQHVQCLPSDEKAASNMRLDNQHHESGQMKFIQLPQSSSSDLMLDEFPNQLANSRKNVRSLKKNNFLSQCLRKMFHLQKKPGFNKGIA